MDSQENPARGRRGAQTLAPSNLPTPAAQLVGRSEAIAMIRSLFSQHRMITIVGPGGIGKTALAIEVAQGMRGTMRSQIYFVDLAAVLDPVFVAAAAASSMGISV